MRAPILAVHDLGIIVHEFTMQRTRSTKDVPGNNSVLFVSGRYIRINLIERKSNRMAKSSMLAVLEASSHTSLLVSGEEINSSSESFVLLSRVSCNEFQQ